MSIFSRFKGLSTLAGLAVVMSPWKPLIAQEDFSLQASVECFRQSALAGEPGAACENGATPLLNVVIGWRTWDAATVQAVADALVEESASEQSGVAIVAIHSLAMLGLQTDGSPGRPGTVDLLERAFERTQHRSAVLDVTHSQSERHEVIDFLSNVVRGDRPSSPQTRRQAAVNLYRLGAEGRVALRALRGHVGDSSVAAKVERLSVKPEH